MMRQLRTVTPRRSASWKWSRQSASDRVDLPDGSPQRGPVGHLAATIVEYTDEKQPENRYPKWIISPPRSGPCCFSDMEEIGDPREDGRWVFQYKRCRRCGFTVRVILWEIADTALIAEVREILGRSFVRDIGD